MAEDEVRTPSARNLAARLGQSVQSRTTGIGGVDYFDVLLASLLALLVAGTVIVVAEPRLSLVVMNARFDLVGEVMASLIALGVAGLAWIRFRERPEPGTILLASAFVFLGISSAIVAAVIVIRAEEALGMAPSVAGQAPLYAWLTVRTIAGLLLLYSGIAGRREDTPIRRPRLILALSATAAAAVWAGFEAVASRLPPLLGPEGVRQLATNPVVPTVLPGMTPALVLGHVGVALLFGLAAVGQRQAYRMERRLPTALLCAGLLVAAFSNLHYALYPAGYATLITTGDWLRFVFYAVLLLVMRAEVAADLSDLRRANDELEALRDAEVARAALEERARLAREVHDSLSQDLWFAKLKQSRLLGRRLQGESRILAQEVAKAIDAALAEARQAVWASRIDPTVGGSFEGILAQYVEDFGDRYGLRSNFELDGPLPTLPPRVQAETLRIVQEALNNVRKHANATSVRVRMAVDDGRLQVGVVDDGGGFEPERVAADAAGLQIMRERAGLIGAELRVISAPGHGTEVALVLPVRR